MSALINIPDEMKNISAQLGQEENKLLQLVKNISHTDNKVKDTNSRMQAAEAEIEALKKKVSGHKCLKRILYDFASFMTYVTYKKEYFI